MKIFDHVKELVFPEKCRFCKAKISKEEAPFCQKCRKIYDSEKYRVCKGCGRYVCRCICRPKNGIPEVFTYLSVFRYKENTPGGRLILSIKDRRDNAALSLLSKDLSLTLQAGCILSADALVTYVPRRKSAVVEKGTDQAMELAKATAQYCSLSFLPTLAHSSFSAEQKTLSAAERKKSAEDSYSLLPDCPDLSNKQVILIDDIRTSGATVNSCAVLLKSAGAKQIICLTVGVR